MTKKLNTIVAALLLATVSAVSASEQYFAVTPFNATVRTSLNLTEQSIPDATRGSSYTHDFNPLLTYSGFRDFSPSKLTWTLTGENIDGLTLDARSGILTGVPTATADATLLVTASYQNKSATQPYHLTVIQPVIKGQQQWTGSGTYTWIVPEGVTSVSAVAVGGGGAGGSGINSCSTGRAGSRSAFGTYAVANGGGGGYTYSSGGLGGTVSAGTGFAGGRGRGGGGGAGGYTAVGGDGGSSDSGYYAAGGGGVGLLGGTSGGRGGMGGYAYTGNATGGAGGSGGAAGGNNNKQLWAGSGGAYGGGGGGAGGQCGGGGGGGLAYANNIQVSPGQAITITVGAGGTGSTVGSGATGAVRVIWPGNTRFFPNTNTANQ